jgi:hypothetical protein
MFKSVKMKKVLAFGIFTLLVLSVIFLFYLGSNLTTASNDPPVGELTPVNSGTGGSIYGTVWQSLYVTPTQGQPYWANAPKQFDFMAILGSPTGNGDDFTEVQKLQNNIYMNLAVEGVSTWAFSCQETITITDEQGNFIATIVDSQTVNGNGQSVAANTNAWVQGASLTGQQLQNVLNLPAGTYYFTVTLNNINLLINVNGQQQQLSALPGTDENVLSWLIQVT